MKQHITPKQAKEVTEAQFYSLFGEIVPRSDWANYHHTKMTIRKMIECLGGANIEVNPAGGFGIEANGKRYVEKELADALWLAVKDAITKG
ncbi:hypothetical protein [Bacillus thuringiensis]|uniref:hypothetical protein n=1 Tax=Bacillus thuringiensis TaxID=1428 RepID=UPI000BFD320E|nr:hypothetical protein [Bacillus thuringiensis]PGT89817.1 hypothetical protein COD17_08700 [Bacillus thuringiensis]